MSHTTLQPLEQISFVLKAKKASNQCVTTFEQCWMPVVRGSIAVAGGEAQICGLTAGLKLCLKGPVGRWMLWVIGACVRFHDLEKYFYVYSFAHNIVSISRLSHTSCGVRVKSRVYPEQIHVLGYWRNVVAQRGRLRTFGLPLKI